MIKTLPRRLAHRLDFASAVADRKIRSMAPGQILTSHIEVERKFVPTALLETQLDGRYGEYERLRRLQAGSSTAQQSSNPALYCRQEVRFADAHQVP